MKTAFNEVFTPKAHVSRSAGKYTLYLYPTITSDMVKSEKNFAYMVNVAALEASECSYSIKSQTLAASTGTEPLVAIIREQFKAYAKKQLSRAGKFKVLSYHKANGVAATSATEVDGKLKPVSGLRSSSRRPAGLTFAKLEVKFDFPETHFTKQEALAFGNALLAFYARLACTSETVTDHHGDDVPWFTFHGPDGWASSDDQDVIDSVLCGSHAYGYPFELKPDAIDPVNNPATLVSLEPIMGSIVARAIWIACKTKIFNHLCPGAENDPVKIITALSQTSVGADGKEINLTVSQFHQNILNVTHFLPVNSAVAWGFDLTAHFHRNLTVDIRDQMTADGFLYSSSDSSQLPFGQIMSLSRAMMAATLAEETLARYRRITSSQINNSLTLHSGVQVNASAAEGTMVRYQPQQGRIKFGCFGCGEPTHSWVDKRGNGICPRRHEQPIKDTADKNLLAFRARMKAKGARKRKQYQSNSDSSSKNLLSNFTSEQIQKFSPEVLAALVSGSKTSTPSDSAPAERQTHTFVVSVFESSVNQLTLPSLPISRTADMPHFSMPLGRRSDGAPRFFLTAVFDSAAGLTCGRLAFHLAIAEKFPELVKSLVHSADKFSPIQLSGVVAADSATKDSGSKTDLTVIIEYHLPMLTKEGHEVSLKIALGENVSVNTIIGIPMIRPAKLSLDLNDDVVMNGILDTEPFPVTFHPTSSANPNLSNLSSDHSTRLLASAANHITSSDVAILRSALKAQKIDSTTAVLEANLAPEESAAKPIKVPKPQYRKKPESMWTEEINNQLQDINFDFQFQSNNSNTLRKYKPASLPPPNPAFHCLYDPAIHAAELNSNLILDPSVPIDIQKRVRALVIEFWDVFRSAGVSIPIRGYEMVIDTGKHQPIACRQPRYGMHETPIMQNTIDKLLSLGFIQKDSTSPWGSRITLAAKPHQESVTDISKYEWRFCINYVRLNMVTRPSAYPIPRCDDAVMNGFGTARYYILFDAFSGYHQVLLTPESAMKTAFFAPNGRKYCWVVMPFGLKNCPPVYIAMMHDLKELWTIEAEAAGLDMSCNNGSTLIMDDAFLFGATIDNTFLLARCVCIVARKYQLTWKLKKARWLPETIEFVGVDIHQNGGNSPAASKDILLKHWKVPATPRDALAFIGFAIFYLRWLPWFEQEIRPIRATISEFHLDHEYLPGQFPAAAIAAFHSVRKQILSKPILQRADIKKRFYLKTDFSAIGLGFALCQPDNQPESLAAMAREDAGGACEFDFALSKLRLFLIAMGSRRTKGSEVHFHSFPGEALAACWAIVKNRHWLWGRFFSILTDCRALLWLMDYKGHNHTVHRLQLEMLGYNFTIVHRPCTMLEDANYFSRLSANIHIDPLLKQYLYTAHQNAVDHPSSPDALCDQNMPGRRTKRAKPEPSAPDVSINLAHAECLLQPIDLTPATFDCDRQFLNIPVLIMETGIVQPKSTKHFAYASETAVHVRSSKWCLSQPGHGHFIQSCRESSIQFEPVIVCDTDQNCRNSMQSKFNVPFIFDSPISMAEYCDSNALPIIHGYFAQIDPSIDVHLALRELKIHERIITQLKSKAKLEIFLIQFPACTSSQAFARFKTRFTESGWMLSEHHIRSSVHFSDRIAFNFDLIIGINSQYHLEAPSLQHLSPTPVSPNHIQPKLMVEYDLPKFSVPYLGELFTVEEPVHRIPSREPTVQYIIRHSDPNTEPTLDVGFQVFHKDAPAPLPSQTNIGLFGSLFGISFANPRYTASNNEQRNSIRSISIAEYTSLFGYDDEFSSYLIRQPDVPIILRRTLPMFTANRLAETANYILKLSQIIKSDSASEASGFDLSVPALFNGVIGNALPDDSAWAISYSQDPACAAIIAMLSNPGTIDATNLLKIHSSYRGPLRQSKIKWEQGRLVIDEPVAQSTKSVRLTIVPNDLRHHVFVSFHSNPIGGHFSLYYTLHRIRLRFHWPGMYSYLKRNIDNCAACLLRNSSARASSELLYAFPLHAPMACVHADAWVAGATVSHEGYVGLMILTCHMTGFTAIQPLRKMNSTSFARSVYSIMLRYGLSQMVVTDPDNKFKGEFKEAFRTLNIKHHLGARGNHNSILVERFNKFLNAGLRVFDHDRGTHTVFVEGAELLTYAWNSCPVLGTDLSRSLLTVGREYHFPIDFVAKPQINLDNTTATTQSFADTLTDTLIKSREIYAILISEHRAAHREFRNAQINHPRLFKKDDIVFTNVQVQSKKVSGVVAKLTYIRRGPYRVIIDHPGGSYDLMPLTGRAKAIIKKHGSQLYLAPETIQPHAPIQASDQKFGNLSKQPIPDPFSFIGLKGYSAAEPWAAPAALCHTNLALVKDIQAFPTLLELDDEFDGFPESGNPFINDAMTSDPIPQDLIRDSVVAFAATARTKGTIIADLVRSEDKLFFIAYSSERNQLRKEWKLVRVNFKASLKQHPTCLQDGRFLTEFYIQNYRDDKISPCNRRYWLEYHKSNSHQTLSTDYHIIQPSQYSEITATRLKVSPFSDWVNISDPEVAIHGPFDFAVLNNRKTRDRISDSDWQALRLQSRHFHNSVPPIGIRALHVDITQPIYEVIKADAQVASRCNAFMLHLTTHDETLADYGQTPLP